MSILKRILIYIIWSLLAIIFAFVYLRIILGPIPESESTAAFWQIVDSFLVFAFIYMGLIIGSIIAVLFIVIDIFYLNKKLKAGISSAFIRLFVLVFITVVVSSIHYVLEKVIDVI